MIIGQRTSRNVEKESSYIVEAIEKIEWSEGLAMHRVTGPLTLQVQRECMFESHYPFELSAVISGDGRRASDYHIPVCKILERV